MTERNKGLISCTDGFRRQRSVGVWTAPTAEQVVLVAPPAEAALLSPPRARELGELLIELASVAEREHRDLVQAGKCGWIAPAHSVGSPSSLQKGVA
jgi:hypothetical protein